ncbi:MAG: hypothetical protein VX453_10320 [Acidobacteriota bacterium]|jgi:hypothetical protein|nr:hypothetical protein [Acidobacteriota bacterium]
MTDQQDDRLEPLRRLVEAADDPQTLKLVQAVVDILEQDTARVLDQTHIARDIAGRTKAGDWFGNTELAEVLADADYFLRLYKQQRDGLGDLKAALSERRGQLDSPG